jgi:methylated-DNA-protein-cysteine methyltransferase related protein
MRTARRRTASRSGQAIDRPTHSLLRRRVYAILRNVPRGKVVTYGQLALLAGNPRAARQVGWIAHAGGPDLPWQRVVNRFGGLATGYRGGRRGHGQDLRADGVRVRADFTVDLDKYQWWPEERTFRRLRLGPEIIAAITTLPVRRPPGRTPHVVVFGHLGITPGNKRRRTREAAAALPAFSQRTRATKKEGRT